MSHSLTGSWDVVVIGAGPAGSAAASACAKRGLLTLLVEKAAFPRSKVCGGCLSPQGVRCLAELGVLETLKPHAVPIESFRLLAQSRSLDVPLTSAGLAIGRETLDLALLLHAQSFGATVRQSCLASLMDANARASRLRLISSGNTAEITARAIIVADGLAGSFLPRDERWMSRVAVNSRFGVGTIVPPALIDELVPDRTIAMHVGREGYVGFVKLQDGSIDAAAALDPSKTKQRGGPEAAIASILMDCGRKIPAGFKGLSWHGTPLLTRKRSPEGPGIFVVGDAAAYVEPFTGEGMSWALRAGLAVAEHAELQCRGGYKAQSWTNELARLSGERRRACGVISGILRSPRVVSTALRVASMVSPVRSMFQSRVSGPWMARSA